MFFLQLNNLSFDEDNIHHPSCSLLEPFEPALQIFDVGWFVCLQLLQDLRSVALKTRKSLCCWCCRRHCCWCGWLLIGCWCLLPLVHACWCFFNGSYGCCCCCFFFLVVVVVLRDLKGHCCPCQSLFVVTGSCWLLLFAVACWCHPSQLWATHQICFQCSIFYDWIHFSLDIWTRRSGYLRLSKQCKCKLLSIVQHDIMTFHHKEQSYYHGFAANKNIWRSWGVENHMIREIWTLGQPKTHSKKIQRQSTTSIDMFPMLSNGDAFPPMAHCLFSLNFPELFLPTGSDASQGPQRPASGDVLGTHRIQTRVVLERLILVSSDFWQWFNPS